MPSERTGPDLHGVIVTGLSIVLGVILLVILLQIVHFHLSDREVARKVLDVPHAEYTRLVEAQSADLAGAGIEAAMAEVVARHGEEAVGGEGAER